jgi:hypothetical protein
VEEDVEDVLVDAVTDSDSVCDGEAVFDNDVEEEAVWLAVFVREEEIEGELEILLEIEGEQVALDGVSESVLEQEHDSDKDNDGGDAELVNDAEEYDAEGVNVWLPVSESDCVGVRDV